MEIVADILTEALNGANKTRIMYRANLNFLRFNSYLSEMLENGLLKKQNDGNGRTVYKVTEDGKGLLETLRKAQEYMSV
jgi:predicted transcriptional regulator